jgi:hypothetical protein
MQRAFLTLLLVATTGCGGSVQGGSRDAGAPGPIVGATGDAGTSSVSTQPPINHRPSDALCSSVPPAADCMLGAPADTCERDSQCTAGVNGRCFANGDGPISHCECTYDECQHDSQCSGGSTCVCHGSPYTGGAGNTCKASDCRVDADCGSGGFCSPSMDVTQCNGAGVAGYFCHTASDQCTNDSDCPQATAGPEACVYTASAGHWACATVSECE